MKKVIKVCVAVLLVVAACIIIPGVILMNRTYSVRLSADDKSSEIAFTASLADARAIADQNAVYGYRVYDDNGNMVYCTYTLLQSDILREAKWVTDYVRVNKFKYGDAPINPAYDHEAKLVSCDRLVDWVLYRVGFTDQVERQGMVVYFANNRQRDLADWCEDHSFIRIEDPALLQPGDVVFVHPHTSSSGKTYPGHTFVFGGFSGSTAESYRYDCGSDARIQSVQPFYEPLINFMFAYRPCR